MHPLEIRLKGVWSPDGWANVSLLLAISGGSDSVAMLRAILRLKADGPGRLIVAHFNHGLRDDEVTSDEQFVRTLSARFDLACEIGRAQCGELTDLKGDGLESAARQARYAFFQTTAERVGARYVVTAHTANDQAETVVHHIIRGTGLNGLAGIPRARRLGPAVTLMRPMLDFRRSELLDYLQSLNQPYREDQTNRDTRFTRNAIRHQLLPQLEANYNRNVIDALVRLGRMAAEAQEVIDALVADLVSRTVNPADDGSVSLHCEPLVGQSRFLVREVIKAAWKGQEWSEQAMGFSQWDRLAGMITEMAPACQKQTFPGGVLVERKGKLLVLAPRDLR